MNDFATDNVWQREQRDRLLVPLYKKKLRSFTLADDDMSLQKRGIDTVLYYHDGTVVTVEEKIVRWPGYEYNAFALETHSCTIEGMESPGWMFYSEALVLLYCFQREDGGLVCAWIDFAHLRDWFKPIEKTFSPFQMETRNRTRGRVVPIAAVVAAGIKCRRFQIGPGPDGLDHLS